MRNFSVVAAVVVVLLNSSCTSCLEEGDAPPGPRPETEPINPFKLLNDYLADHAESSDLAMNIEAAKKYLSEPEKDPAVVELVELFVKINPNEKFDSQDACKFEGVTSKLDFIQALEAHEPNYNRERNAMMRLGTLVHNFSPPASKACFEDLEKQWLKNWPSFQADLKDIIGMSIFKKSDQYHKKDPLKYGLPNVRSDVLMLANAVNDHFHRNEDPFRYELPTDDKEIDSIPGLRAEIAKIRSVLNYCQFELRKEELKEARGEAKREIHDPCEKFVEHEQSKSILAPVVLLARLVDITKLKISSVEVDQSGLFLWASRYSYCKEELKHQYERDVRVLLKVAQSMCGVDVPSLD